MKTLIIHTHHAKSKNYAQQAFESFSSYTGWEPQLFQGVTIESLARYESKYRIRMKKHSRAEAFLQYDSLRYVIKKCCSLNHYRLFKFCVMYGKPIAVVEHDSHCIGDWNPDIKFQDLLVLNVESAIQQFALHDLNMTSEMYDEGIHPIRLPLFYKHDPKLENAHMMPGTAAYAVTPEGAAKMIKVYEGIGWEQSDHIMNTGYVSIETIVPELFTFKLPNLKMSHGENMK